MISYGLACVVVCALSYFDARARPFAFVIMLGWLSGYCLGVVAPDSAYRLWPLISLVSGVVLYSFWLQDRQAKWKAVSLLAGVMLCLDVLYLGLRWQRVPVELEYSRALDFCLAVQLVLIGWKGAINAGVGLWRWLPGRLHLGALADRPPLRKEASE